MEAWGWPFIYTSEVISPTAGYRAHVCESVLIANALVSSRLDYLFRSLSMANMLKLQGVQNTLARIVTRHTKFSSTTPLLKKLHWLPVRYCSIFKTATIVYKFLHTGNPSYFSKSIILCMSSYDTRLSKSYNMFLNVPLFSPSVYTSKKQFILWWPTI